jgi:hypothetical protein
MDKSAALINAHLPKLFGDFAAATGGMASTKFPFQVQEIELVTHSIFFGRRVQGGKVQRTFGAGGLMIRTVKPFDWKAQLRAWWPNLSEVQIEGAACCRLPKVPAFGPRNGAVYFPDDRTMVADDEEALAAIIRRKGRPPEWVKGIDWEQVQGDLFTVVIDNSDGQLGTILGKGEPEEIPFMPLVQGVRFWALGLCDRDQIDFRALAACTDARAGEATARAVETLLQMGRQEVSQTPDLPKDEKQRVLALELIRQSRAFLTSLHVAREGASISIRTTGAPQLGDLVGLVLESEVSQDHQRTRPAR